MIATSGPNSSRSRCWVPQGRCLAVRELPADGGRQPAEVAVGRPGDEPDPPARPADAQQLGGGAVRAGGRHGVSGRQHRGELAGLRRGRLRLASFPTAIATLVPRAVAEFSRRHPEVGLTVVDDHHQGVLRRLARWELDLALIYDHASLPAPEMALERTHLLDDPFDLVVPHGHPLAGRTSAALAGLAGETWIGGTPGGAYARIVLRSCRAAGFEPRVVFGSDDYNAVQAFVAVGLGVAMLPRLALTVPRPGLARVTLDDPPVREIAAARLAASFRSAAATSMLGVLQECATTSARPQQPRRP